MPQIKNETSACQPQSFCLTVSSPEVRHLCESDNRLAVIIKEYGDLEYQLHSDHFKSFIETIVGQMLSSKVADVITERLENLCGGDISCAKLLSLDFGQIRSIGLSRMKTEYIVGFAKIVQENPGFFEELEQQSEQEVLSRLTAIRGIGNWSAKMYLIFSLNKPDILPYEDGAFLQAYKWLYQTEDISPKSIIARCKAWKPYSSIAARYLYRALDNNMIGNPTLRTRLDKATKNQSQQTQ